MRLTHDLEKFFLLLDTFVQRYIKMICIYLIRSSFNVLRLGIPFQIDQWEARKYLAPPCCDVNVGISLSKVQLSVDQDYLFLL